ncbi:translation initiation factor IF-2-like [Accipiter gentilis]|uniref:translation initiation factor IF-2-like n=1 Tax=Astur gentilis TaxID=8957 RepID=UPI0021104D0C|nr:translation initiation factor IF-2-like [Accipiter gentilis]
MLPVRRGVGGSRCPGDAPRCAGVRDAAGARRRLPVRRRRGGSRFPGGCSRCRGSCRCAGEGDAPVPEPARSPPPPSLPPAPCPAAPGTRRGGGTEQGEPGRAVPGAAVRAAGSARSRSSSGEAGQEPSAVTVGPAHAGAVGCRPLSPATAAGPGLCLRSPPRTQRLLSESWGGVGRPGIPGNPREFVPSTCRRPPPPRCNPSPVVAPDFLPGGRSGFHPPHPSSSERQPAPHSAPVTDGAAFRGEEELIHSGRVCGRNPRAGLGSLQLRQHNSVFTHEDTGPCWGHRSVLWTRAVSSRVPWDGFVGCRFGKESWLGEPPALCLSAAQLLILAAINHHPAPSLAAAAAWFC